jgi:hypothetical protein
MTNDLVCDSQAFAGALPGLTSTPCTPPGYPQATGVDMPPVPSNLPSMPNACAGVPVNPWCPAQAAGKGKGKGKHHNKKHRKHHKKKHHKHRRRPQLRDAN